ncbi:MAG TPA: FAD:protein FMN transferase, partial [Planctomycetaceae bacterium]|nr:FAD:protein FMN transferase [Planctomycetaceae bacterium]
GPGVGGLQRYEFQQILMGVPVKVLVYSRQEALANAGVHAAFERIRQLNLIFSDYDDESEISRLVRTAGPGHPVPVSRELFDVLEQSLEIARQSNGAFDVTVGPLVQLWRKARRTKKLPTPQELAAAKGRIGYQFVRLNRPHRTVELFKPNMQLDFGGIVKCYAAQEARDVLKSHGLPRALVALSGDIAAGDPPPDAPGWRIAIQGIALEGIATKGNGRPDAAPDQYVVLHNECISTAGDTYQFVEIGGKRYSHILDPKTGLGITRRISVTVIAPTGLESDGLDTTAAILGPDKGLKLLQSVPGLEGRIVELTPTGLKTIQTPGFAKYIAPAPAK